MDEKKNAAAGMTKEELWAHAETGTKEELHQLRDELIACGYSEEGTLLKYITARITEE